MIQGAVIFTNGPVQWDMRLELQEMTASLRATDGIDPRRNLRKMECIYFSIEGDFYDLWECPWNKPSMMDLENLSLRSLRVVTAMQTYVPPMIEAYYKLIDECPAGKSITKAWPLT